MNRTVRVVLGLWFLCSLLLVNVSSVWAMGLYDVTDLGAVGGAYSVALGINNNGDVVGYWKNTSGAGDPHYAFRYLVGTGMDDLSSAGTIQSEARDINEAGTIAGYYYPGTLQRAAIYSGTGFADLGTLGGATSAANAINNADQVVGIADVDSSTSHAFLYPDPGATPDQMLDIGTLGGSNSEAYDINDSGQVVGRAQNASSLYHAFLYPDPGATPDQMQDLGTLDSGPFSSAQAINGAGDVAGYSSLSSGAIHAFLYSGGTMQDLNPSGDPAIWDLTYDINESGLVAGTWQESGAKLPFVYDPDTATMQDLNTLRFDTDPGWTLTEANAVNDNGWIVGAGVFGSQTHAYLATPHQDPVTPELPSGALLMLSALPLGLAWWRRRRSA